MSRLRKKQNVAAGMGKIGMAALVVDFRQINFGSIAATTILSSRLLKTEEDRHLFFQSIDLTFCTSTLLLVLLPKVATIPRSIKIVSACKLLDLSSLH